MKNILLLEELASIEHDRWVDWQRYCHEILRRECPSSELERVLERWDKQIATKYEDLTEKEKQSDRDQVMRYWYIFFPKDKPKEAWNGFCRCTHLFNDHGKSFSINWSAGKCKSCACVNFYHNPLK